MSHYTNKNPDGDRDIYVFRVDDRGQIPMFYDRPGAPPVPMWLCQAKSKDGAELIAQALESYENPFPRPPPPRYGAWITVYAEVSRGDGYERREVTILDRVTGVAVEIRQVVDRKPRAMPFNIVVDYNKERAETDHTKEQAEAFLRRLGITATHLRELDASALDAEYAGGEARPERLLDLDP